MEGGSEDEGALLFDNNVEKNTENKWRTFCRTKKWFLIFGLTFVVALTIIIAFVATKSHSNSSNKCSSGSDNQCLFEGATRLPKNVIPEKYTLSLEVNMKEFTFNGRMIITVVCSSATNQVILHEKGLKFTKDDMKLRQIGQGSYNDIIIEELRRDLDNEQVLLKVNKNLERNGRYEIIITYHSNLNTERLEGFYRSSYTTKSGEKRYLATTHFEATSARQAFPCFDEPELKAKFKITITRPATYVALSNMPAESSEILRGDLNQTTFMESVEMSTYLVAFVICDFSHIENTTANGVKIRVWAPDDVINEADLALTSASVILDYYEKYFDTKYPLPKQDLIAIPDFSAGAMENWGLITYRLTSLLVDPDQSSSSSEQWVATVVAHELAHQWFGNLVTMKWWDDLWLNEGFASYVENIGVDIFRPNWKMMEQFLITNVQRSMHLDQLATSHPISAVVKNPNEISSLFDDISYHKGASLIRMTNEVLGSHAFNKGIQNYLKKYKFGNAATNDLWQSLTENTNIDVEKVMSTWTLQMGFPVVTVTKQKHGVYKASQQHFLIDNERKPSQSSPFGYKWYIPLTYRTNRNFKKSQIEWMKMKDVTIEIDVSPQDGDWFKMNDGQTGYYRVNYPIENWQNMVEALNTDHQQFSVADRAGLIDDAFSLARAGQLSYDIALDLTLYLGKENDYVVWASALNGLAYIEGRLALSRYYGLYQQYLLSKITPVLTKLSYEDTGGHLQRYLRDVLFGEAVYFDFGEAEKEAEKMFDNYINNDKTIAPNFRHIVYGFGIRNGGMKEWDFMFEKYKKELIASEKSLMLSSLSSTRRPWLLQRLLDDSLNSSLIKSQDADIVVSEVASTPNGRLLAWDFFEQNWPLLYKRYGTEAFSLGRLVKSVAAHFQTDFHFKQVQSFFTSHSEHGSAERSIQQTYETIQSNIHWMKNYEEQVISWLQKHT